MAEQPNETMKELLGEVDEKSVANEIWGNLNKIYKYTTHLINFRYHLLLYRLLKKGYISMAQITEVTGYTKTRIYQILSDFEKREKERRSVNIHGEKTKSELENSINE